MGGRGASSGAVPRAIQFKAGDFDGYRFSDLRASRLSNKYYQIDRVNAAKDKVVVNAADDQIFQTKYGYGLILNDENVLWLKNWQVDNGNGRKSGTNVLLQKNYFRPQKSSFKRPDYTSSDDNLDWNEWVRTAQAQAKNGRTTWKIDGQRRLLESLNKQRKKKKAQNP